MNKDTKPRKYEFTGETRTFLGRTVHRIRRLSDGLIGGWLERESNLSHSGTCFVYDNGTVIGDASVRDASVVADNGWVSRYAVIEEEGAVLGNAHVGSRSVVSGYSEVCEDSYVHGDARINGSMIISGVQEVTGWEKKNTYRQKSLDRISNRCYIYYVRQ